MSLAPLALPVRAVPVPWYILPLLILLTVTGCDSGGGEDGILPPSDVSATATDAGVQLTWTGGSEGYNLYRSRQPMSDVSGRTPINGASPVSSPPYLDGDTENTTLYYYRITSVGAGGTESEPSGEVQVQTLYPQPPGRP
mgnify:CR=1 FL=1